jgi:Anti-sigma regulatory factor (Ser/Thr protein kinase)
MDDEPALELTLPSRAESVTVVRQALSAFADIDGWDPTFLTDLKIAVSEACANVVMHAYPNTDGPMRITIERDADRLVVLVADHGVGMTPRVDSPGAGLGLGLPLIAAISDEVQVRSPNEGPTEVRMTFTVPAMTDEATVR